MCETVTQQTRVAPRGAFLGRTSFEPTEAPTGYVRFLGLGHQVIKQSHKFSKQIWVCLFCAFFLTVAILCEEKPRSQKRDLGHPLNINGTSPVEEGSIFLAVNRQIGPLVRKIGGDFFPDIDAKAGRISGVHETLTEDICMGEGLFSLGIV